MKTTVITVCLNAVETIERTIRSVLWQDYPDIEYIIVDGMSTDGTLDIINKYRDRISLLIREPDEGLYDAMNKGILRSSGEIISFVNADDCFAAPDVLSRVAKTFSEHPDKMIIYGDCVKDKGTTQILHRHPDSIQKRFFRISALNQQSMFYRRITFDIVGLFDKSYTIFADYDWNIRAFLIHKLSYLHIPLTICIYNSGGTPGRVSHIKNTELPAIQRKYFSRKERLYFMTATLMHKLVNRVATRNFSIPVGVRTFVEMQRQNLKSFRRNA